MMLVLALTVLAAVVLATVVLAANTAPYWSLRYFLLHGSRVTLQQSNF